MLVSRLLFQWTIFTKLWQPLSLNTGPSPNYTKQHIDIVLSFPGYLGDYDCIQNIWNLLKKLVNIDYRLGKTKELGAADLIMTGMNLNIGIEDLQASGQKVLQNLVGGDVEAPDQTL